MSLIIGSGSLVSLPQRISRVKVAEKVESIHHRYKCIQLCVLGQRFSLSVFELIYFKKTEQKG